MRARLLDQLPHTHRQRPRQAAAGPWAVLEADALRVVLSEHRRGRHLERRSVLSPRGVVIENAGGALLLAHRAPILAQPALLYSLGEHLRVAGLDFALEPLRVVVARSVQPRQLGEARPREHARLHDALREHDAARHRCLRGLPVPRRDGHRHMSIGSYKTGALRRRP